MKNIIRLINIDFLKFKNYPAFWIILILYSILVFASPIGVMEFLKWLKSLMDGSFDGFDPTKVPILHFPDIWQNLTFLFGFVKLFLAILVIISITNEISFKTIRQNVIDGFSREEFAISKIGFVFCLSLYSTLLIFITGMLTGLIYSTSTSMADIFYGIEFLGGYLLDVFATLLIALLVGLLVKRSGFSIALFLLIWPAEYLLTSKLPDSFDSITKYFPIHAIHEVINWGFPKYWFQEIQDYVALEPVLVIMAYIALFIFLIFRRLKKTDI